MCIHYRLCTVIFVGHEMASKGGNTTCAASCIGGVRARMAIVDPDTVSMLQASWLTCFFLFVQTSQVPFPTSTALLRCRLPAGIHHPDMESQLSTTTVVETVTITNGPEINNQQFQGWYIHTDDSSCTLLDNNSLVSYQLTDKL